MRRGRVFIIIVVCLAILIPTSLATWKTYIRIAPGKAAEAYIRALITGDKAGAQGVSSGAAAFNAQKATGSAGVVKLDIEVTDVGPGWAEALAYTELAWQTGLMMRDGTRRILIQPGGAWKVISLTEAQPWASGLFGFNSKQDVEAVTGVFTSYLQLLTQNRYQDAAKLLCGERGWRTRLMPLLWGKPPCSSMAEAFIFLRFGEGEIRWFAGRTTGLTGGGSVRSCDF